MPNKTLLSMSKKHDIPIKKLEKDWDYAVKETENNFGIEEKDFKSKHFAYIMGIIKNINKIKENATKDFLESKLDSKSFIESLMSETVISSNVDVDSPMTYKKDDGLFDEEDLDTTFSSEAKNDYLDIKINDDSQVDANSDGYVDENPVEYNDSLDSSLDNDNYEAIIDRIETQESDEEDDYLVEPEYDISDMEDFR